MDIINHIPAGAGYKQFVHYGQISLTGNFSFLSKKTKGASFYIDRQDKK